MSATIPFANVNTGTGQQAVVDNYGVQITTLSGLTTVSGTSSAGTNVLNTVAGMYYQNITDQATYVLKVGAGVLHSIVINKPLGSGVVTVYDNTAGSGNKIATITMPATILSTGPENALYDVLFATGLTVVTSGASQDVTVSFR